MKPPPKGNTARNATKPPDATPEESDPCACKATVTATVAPLAVDAKTAAGVFSVSLRSWWRWNSSGRIPPAHELGQRKVWRVDDLTRWASMGFPSRAEFQAATTEATSGE